MSLYLDLLQKVLTREIWIDDPALLAKRQVGLDWPGDGAETMVGAKRLQNVRALCQDVMAQNIPGDFMECGTWKGGCAIMMAAVLADWEERQQGQSDRTIWVADSFQGCPKPDPERYPADRDDPHHTFGFLAVPKHVVQRNFERYGLLRPKVQFLEGWFRDTLPGPVGTLSVLRLDGDLYESTMQCLVALYDKVSPGGYVIIDDFGAVLGCREAVGDFLATRGLTPEVIKIDWGGVYWKVQ